MSDFKKYINCKGKLVDLSKPLIMGIVNATPDSFYDGNVNNTVDLLFAKAEKMINEGADILDIGGASSKPGAKNTSAQLELERVIPLIKKISEKHPEQIISIDTYNAEVAKSAIESGATIINDISAGMLDENMLQTVADLQVPYIMMHMRGNPTTMQNDTEYKNIINEMVYYFSERIEAARKLGINDLILDPGFGFSKTVEQNYLVFEKLFAFKIFDLPLLVGISRKSMIYKKLELEAKDALNGTTVLNTLALAQGANIIRVHDVKEAVEARTLVDLTN